MDALRTDLAEAIAKAADNDIQFPVSGVEIEFHVGVTKSAEARTGFKFWVFELGAGGEYAKESVQKLTLRLDAPLDKAGRPIKVARSGARKP
jgi:hypothetical protein